jgi:hypothetical protein
MELAEINRSGCTAAGEGSDVRRLEVIWLIALALLTPFQADAQDKPPTVEQMHMMFENAAREANAQLSNTRMDDHTVLKLMTYDRRVPVMTYHYTSNVLAALRKTELDPAARRAMFDYHRGKTCGTHFTPFMRVYGLKVAHRFEDAKTGRELITLTIEGKDCAK